MSNHTCLQCRVLKDRIEELESALGLKQQIPRSMGFTPMHATYLSMLLARPDVTIPRDTLLLAHRSQEICDRRVDRNMMRLRKQLKQYGATVKTDYGMGYRITAPDAAKLQAAIAAAQPQARAA